MPALSFFIPPKNLPTFLLRTKKCYATPPLPGSCCFGFDSLDPPIFGASLLRPSSLVLELLRFLHKDGCFQAYLPFAFITRLPFTLRIFLGP